MVKAGGLRPEPSASITDAAVRPPVLLATHGHGRPGVLLGQLVARACAARWTAGMHICLWTPSCRGSGGLNQIGAPLRVPLGWQTSSKDVPMEQEQAEP